MAKDLLAIFDNLKHVFSNEYEALYGAMEARLSGAVARQMEAAHRTSLAKGEVGIREKKLAPTLGDFCKDRLEPGAKATFQKTVPKSYDWYRTNLRIIQASSLSTLRLDKVTNEHVSTFADRQITKGYAVASVNSFIRVLRRALRLANEWAIMAPNLAKLSGENHRDHVVTRDEEQKYHAACERDPENDKVEYVRYRELSELMRLLFELASALTRPTLCAGRTSTGTVARIGQSSFHEEKRLRPEGPFQCRQF